MCLRVSERRDARRLWWVRGRGRGVGWLGRVLSLLPPSSPAPRAGPVALHLQELPTPTEGEAWSNFQPISFCNNSCSYKYTNWIQKKK